MSISRLTILCSFLLPTIGRATIPTDIRDLAVSYQMVTATIAKCDRLLDQVAKVQTGTVPNSIYVRAHLSTNEFKATLTKEFPAIMGAERLASAIEDSGKEGFERLETASQLLLKLSMSRPTLSLVDGLIAELRLSNWSRLKSNSPTSEALRPIHLSLMKSAANEALRNPKWAGNFVVTYLLALALEQGTGEFERFGRHLLAFQLAHEDQYAGDLAESVTLEFIDMTMDPESGPALERLSLAILQELLPHPTTLTKPLRQDLYKLADEARRLRAFRAAMQEHELSDAAYGANPNTAAARVELIRSVAAHLAASPGLSTDGEVSELILRLIDPADETFHETIRRRVFDDPALADSDLYARFLTNESFREYAHQHIHGLE